MEIFFITYQSAYSGEREHSFRLNVNTFSLNALPTEVCTPGVHVQSISGSRFLMDSPFRAQRWALCISRSRMASAKVLSPMAAYH